MKTITIAALTAALTATLTAALAAPAGAQQPASEHAAHHPASTVAAAAAADMTEGEVRKIDKEANKVTIKHGEIKNLDMPAMTMVFQARNGALLDKLKVGDKIRFVAEQSASGLVVTDIQPAK